jgi:hypothetical protein
VADVSDDAFRMAQHLPLDRIRSICVGNTWVDVQEGSLKAERDGSDDLTGWLSFTTYEIGRTFVRADCVQAFKVGWAPKP